MFLDIVGVGFLVWFFVVIADGWHCDERKSLLRAALSCGVKSLGGNAATNHTDFGGNVWTGRPQIKSQPDPKQIPSRYQTKAEPVPKQILHLSLKRILIYPKPIQKGSKPILNRHNNDPTGPIPNLSPHPIPTYHVYIYVTDRQTTD